MAIIGTGVYRRRYFRELCPIERLFALRRLRLPALSWGYQPALSTVPPPSPDAALLISTRSAGGYSAATISGSLTTGFGASLGRWAFWTCWSIQA